MRIELDESLVSQFEGCLIVAAFELASGQELLVRQGALGFEVGVTDIKSENLLNGKRLVWYKTRPDGGMVQHGVDGEARDVGVSEKALEVRKAEAEAKVEADKARVVFLRKQTEKSEQKRLFAEVKDQMMAVRKAELSKRFLVQQKRMYGESVMDGLARVVGAAVGK